MHPALDRYDRKRALEQSELSRTAWDWSQTGWWHWDLNGIEDMRRARESFGEALEQDGDFATAHAGLALVDYMSLMNGYAKDPEPTIEALLQTSQKAVSLDPQNPQAQHAIGHAYALTGEREKMLASYRRASELSPHSTLVLLCSGEGMAMAGEHEEAKLLLEEAVQLGANDPLIPYAYNAMSLAYFASGDYEEALVWVRKALLEYPEFSWAYRTEASVLAHLGRLDEAGRALARGHGDPPRVRLERRRAHLDHRRERSRGSLSTGHGDGGGGDRPLSD